ncbi:MAG: hypothetical protein IJX13_03610 [Clostridia bacterium]|nr:hypothetical protein [Clostridia bacterium]
MKYNQIVSTVPVNITTNKDFMHYTASETREKVFAKWIKQIFSDDPQYLQIKRNCSLVAGNQVCKKINSAFSANNIFSFFQIYPFEYYYAKTTAHETTILKVPKQADFNRTIQFCGCVCDVPASQLNIISTFKNVHTGKRLQFRNECRFSHGQFNGTPEAKMYVVKDTPLTELYEPIK